MLKDVFDRVIDNRLRISFSDNFVNVVNYKKILVVEENKLLVDCSNFLLDIKGLNLIINRLFNKEILVTGKIKSIEIK